MSCLHFVKTGDLIFRNKTDTFVRRAALFFVHPDDPGLFLNFGWRGFAIRANKMYPPPISNCYYTESYLDSL